MLMCYLYVYVVYVCRLIALSHGITYSFKYSHRAEHTHTNVCLTWGKHTRDLVQSVNHQNYQKS